MSRVYENGAPARCEHCGNLLDAGPRPLTRKQVTLYRFLADRIASQGCAPSFKEISAQFRYRSLATVHEHLVNLERKGWIRRGYNEARSIQLLASPDLSHG